VKSRKTKKKSTGILEEKWKKFWSRIKNFFPGTISLTSQLFFHKSDPTLIPIWKTIEKAGILTTRWSRWCFCWWLANIRISTKESFDRAIVRILFECSFHFPLTKLILHNINISITKEFIKSAPLLPWQLDKNLIKLKLWLSSGFFSYQQCIKFLKKLKGFLFNINS